MGIVGLLHDIDWEHTEQAPEKHPSCCLVAGKGYADDIIRAVQATDGVGVDVEPHPYGKSFLP